MSRKNTWLRNGVRLDSISRERPNTCELCGNGETHKRNTVICLDHDHKTGVFRGWLCSDCNLAIGRFHDDPELMRKAAQYIENTTPRI